MPTPALLDPFHRALYKVLAEKIDDCMVRLASGSATAVQGSVESTAEKYASQVSRIQTLNDVLKDCESIEAELHGTRPRSEAEGG